MTTAETVVAYLLAAGGVAFTAVALVGLLRLPDCYTRAHATSKAETLGALLTLAAAGVALDGAGTVKLVILGVFLFVTSPAAAHAVVRSARQQGVPAAGGDEPTEATDAGERT